MKRIRVFVSSTCFDLRQIRRDLQELISELGHEAFVSDSPQNFAVNPYTQTLDNCLQNVRTSSILFLIIGGRYGHVPQGLGSSITNLEYQEAVRAGIPIFTFVDAEVWSAKKEYDLAKDKSQFVHSRVEDNRVFGLIDEISHARYGDWIFQFTTAQDIAQIVRVQLSYLFESVLADAAKEHFRRELAMWGASVIGDYSTRVLTSAVGIAQGDAVEDTCFGQVALAIEDASKLIRISWPGTALLTSALKGHISTSTEAVGAAIAFAEHLTSEAEESLASLYGTTCRHQFELGHQFASTGSSLPGLLGDMMEEKPDSMQISLDDLTKVCQHLTDVVRESALPYNLKTLAAGAIADLSAVLPPVNTAEFRSALEALAGAVKRVREHYMTEYERLADGALSHIGQQPSTEAMLLLKAMRRNLQSKVHA